jgi:hypothetical protein
MSCILQPPRAAVEVPTIIPSMAQEWSLNHILWNQALPICVYKSLLRLAITQHTYRSKYGMEFCRIT